MGVFPEFGWTKAQIKSPTNGAMSMLLKLSISLILWRNAWEIFMYGN
jgi:hypothetical protein